MSPCELCTKRIYNVSSVLIDAQSAARIRKRTIRNKPITNTVIGSHKISKDDDDNDQIDKQTLKLLTKKSKVEQLQPLLTFPLHKLDNKLNEEEEEQGETMITKERGRRAPTQRPITPPGLVQSSIIVRKWTFKEKRVAVIVVSSHHQLLRGLISQQQAMIEFTKLINNRHCAKRKYLSQENAILLKYYMMAKVT